MASRTATKQIDIPGQKYLRSITLDVAAAIEAVYRSDGDHILATLIRLLGDFDVAEDAAQEAFAAAVDRWPTAGLPRFPRAWIVQTARHKAIDRIRRRTRLEEKLEWWRDLTVVANDSERRLLERHLREVQPPQP